jgi:hypothetical protein
VGVGRVPPPPLPPGDGVPSPLPAVAVAPFCALLAVAVGAAAAPMRTVVVPPRALNSRVRSSATTRKLETPAMAAKKRVGLGGLG